MLLVLKLIVICFVLVDLAQFFAELIDMITIKKIKLLGVIKSLIVYLLSCEKCFSFWFSLIWTGDLFLSSIIAISIWTIFKLKTKLEL